MTRQEKIATVKVLRKHTFKTYREIGEYLNTPLGTVYEYDKAEVRGSLKDLIEEKEKEWI